MSAPSAGSGVSGPTAPAAAGIGSTELPAVTGPIELPGGGFALFTDRAHGNLSSVGGLGAEQGLRSRERLRESLGLRALVRGYQVHGAVVGRVYADGARRGTPGGEDDLPDARAWRDGPAQPSFRADGHATAASGVAAMVLVADCVPVVLAAEGAVAAVHAGWRGLAAGVLEEGMRALRDVGGRGEVWAIVGPCAGACCYEVGAEVHAAFGAHRTLKGTGTLKGTTHGGGQAGHGRPIDLRAIAHKRLLAAGASSVADVPACTICDERFFSHRREDSRAGRQAALVWLS